MKNRHLKSGITAALALSATLLAVPRARAELILYDKDNWTLKHDGLAQGFYSLTMGDSTPTGTATSPLAPYGWGGWDNPPPDDDNKFTSSRFQSGWTGGRFNWVATKKASEETSVSAVLGIAFAISTDNRPTATNNNWDIRNAHIKIEGKSWGDVVIGRHVGLYTLGGIISTINTTSAALGLGNACATGGDGLGCYTSGYGVKFPGFWAGVQYQTPSLGGLRIKVAALDPVTAGVDVAPGDPPVSVAYNRRPLPMFQTLIRYEGDFGGFKLIPYFNGFLQTVGRAGTKDTLTPMGGGAGLDLEVGGLHVGGGATLEHGTSFYGPLYTKSSVIDGNAHLRNGSAFYVHALYSIGGVVDVNAGYGQTNIKPTDFDEQNDLNVQKMQRNIYGAVQYHWDKNLTFMAEVNLLRHKWVAGNHQDVQLYNLGASFTY